MNTYIYKKIGELEQNSIEKYESYILSNTGFNENIFKNPLEDHKTIKIALCVLSKIVYEYDNPFLLRILMKNWELNYEVVCTPDLVYGLFYRENFLFVVFKGTSSFGDMLNNIDFIQADDDYDIPGNLHRGFMNLIFKNNVATSLEKKMNDIIEEYYIDNVYISGHSLGGALATVFHSYLYSSPKGGEKARLHHETTPYLVTFGSPRIGDKEYAKNIKNSTRIVNGNDIITKIPIFGYKHVEKLETTGSCYSYKIISDHHISRYYINLINLKTNKIENLNGESNKC